MKRLALLAVAGVLVAGCGGSGRLSKSAYQQHLQTEGKTVQTSITALTKVSPTSLAQFATRVDAAEIAVKKAADDLGALKPPSDAAADNAAIVTAFRAIQTALEQVKANPTAAAAIVSTLQASPALKAAEKATTDLTNKGYKVGVIGAP
jgi:cell pole-organizing protein PopZ